MKSWVNTLIHFPMSVSMSMSASVSIPIRMSVNKPIHSLDCASDLSRDKTLNKRSVLRRQSRDTNRKNKKVGVLPIRIV